MNDLEIKTISVALKKINYNYIKPQKPDAIRNVNYIDACTIKKVGSDYFELTLSREVKLEPKGPFTLDIEFFLYYEYKKTTEDLNIQKYIEENMAELIENSPVLSYLSLLIGNITSCSDNTPLISPPILMIEDKK